MLKIFQHVPVWRRRGTKKAENILVIFLRKRPFWRFYQKSQNRFFPFNIFIKKFRLAIPAIPTYLPTFLSCPSDKAFLETLFFIQLFRRNLFRSVTRFGEILPLFTKCQSLWDLFDGYWIFGIVLNLLCLLFIIISRISL